MRRTVFGHSEATWAVGRGGTWQGLHFSVTKRAPAESGSGSEGITTEGGVLGTLAGGGSVVSQATNVPIATAIQLALRMPGGTRGLFTLFCASGFVALGTGRFFIAIQPTRHF